ncbi:MAG: putative maltokinase, partial [Planctomycetota bacterium]|nr:putative maltokinase [Planctomycetota bacterium]
TRLMADSPRAVYAKVRTRSGEEGLLYDASVDPEFGRSLLSTIEKRRKFRDNGHEVSGVRTSFYRHAMADLDEPPAPTPSRAEQSNTSILYPDRFILKLYRRASPGVNPDLEIGRYLTDKKGFRNASRIAGALEHQGPGEEPRTLGVLQEYIPNEGDGWRHALDAISSYFERIQSLDDSDESAEIRPPAQPLARLVATERPQQAADLIGPYLGYAELLGKRTAEMHLALAAPTEDESFAPEPFTSLYRRSLYQSMRNLTGRAFRLLRRRLKSLPPEIGELAKTLLSSEGDIMERYRSPLESAADAQRTRIHGDYHLGQVLFTGRDFVIIDFEGEPARSLTERRLKRSPLRDIAGMLRSFDYAAQTGLRSHRERYGLTPDDPHLRRLISSAGFWRRWTEQAFLAEYLRVADDPDFLPDGDALFLMLEVYLLEKATYELAYELNNRPDWVEIPLRGILEILDRDAAA